MNDNARTRRTALFAVTAILLAIGGDAFGEAVCYWPIARFVVWGLESQLAFHAVLLTAILIGCIITGRVADFPKAIIGASLMMAAQTPLAWRYWTTHTGLTHSEWVATQMVPPILILLWLLRAQWVRGAIIASCWGGGYYLADRHLQFTDMLVHAYHKKYHGDLTAAPPRMDIEALYSAKTKLLDDQIAVLAP